MAARANFIRALREHKTVEFSGFWHPEWITREIIGVRSKDVILAHPTKKDDNGNPVKCYLDFPKASEIQEVEENHFVIFDPDNDKDYALAYRFTKD
jgi:hypothetical protein